MIVYKNLQLKYNWLAESVIPSTFLHLTFNELDVVEFKDLEESSAFRKLQENVISMKDQMNVAEFVGCLSGFLWLGVAMTSTTIRSFITELDELPNKDFSILSLHILAVCLLRFSRPDMLMARYIYPRLKHIIESGQDIPNDKKTLFSLIFLGHVSIPDIDVGIWLLQQVLKIVQQTDYLTDPFLAGMTFKFLYDLKNLEGDYNPESFYQNMTAGAIVSAKKYEELLSHSKQLLDIAIIKVMDICDNLSGCDIARIAHSSIHYRGVYYLPWGDIIRKRSLDIILAGNLPVGELMQALEGLRGLSLEEEAQNKIEKIILASIDKADVSSLSYIFAHLSRYGTDNQLLVAACERKITENLSKMLNFRILCKRVFYFLSVVEIENEDFHTFVQSRLIAADLLSISDFVLSYLISQKTWLPSSIELLDMISQAFAYSSLRDLVRILYKITDWPEMKRNLYVNGSMGSDVKLFNAIQNFEIQLGKRYYKAIKENKSLPNVLWLSHKLKISLPEIVCMKTVMDIVEKRSQKEQMNENNFSLLSSIIDVGQESISPEFIDQLLSDFASCQSSRLHIYDNMLKFFCQWYCKESDDVTATVKDKLQGILQAKLDVLIESRNVSRRVINLCYLCCLGVFPEATLMDTLNVDALRRLDEFLEGLLKGHDYSARG